MAPKRSASASPEPSTASRDVSSNSSSDGEQLPAQQTTRLGRTSRPPNRHVPSPGKLLSDATEEYAARRASGEAAAAKRQRAAQRALPPGVTALTAATSFINAAGGTLEANVWPTGPAGVTFSDAECAELHRLLSLFYNAAGWPYKVDPAKGFVRVEWRQFRSWLVGQPPNSELHAAWAAINELLRSKLLAAGILALFFLACWRAVFNLGNTASARPARGPCTPAAWTRRSTEPVAAVWTTTARAAHAGQMAAKVSRMLLAGPPRGVLPPHSRPI
jgi:hypothetical protein